MRIGYERRISKVTSQKDLGTTIFIYELVVLSLPVILVSDRLQVTNSVYQFWVPEQLSDVRMCPKCLHSVANGIRIERPEGNHGS